jgi:protein O-mannosyl-transferase
VGSQSMADRYMYIPSLGIFLILGLGAADLAKKYKVRETACVAAAVGVLLAFSLVTYRQIGFWKDSLTLWSHALAVTEDNFAAEDGLGGALVQQGRTDEAYAHFQRAAALVPDDPVAHADMGVYLHQHGDLPGAIREYEIMLQLNSLPPLRAFIYANLGSAYRQSGSYEKARESFDLALQIDSSIPNIWTGMGDLAMDQNKLDEAIRDYSRAIELKPNAETYIHLGRALTGVGRSSEADRAYRQAERLQPHLTQTTQTTDSSTEERH